MGLTDEQRKRLEAMASSIIVGADVRDLLARLDAESAAADMIAKERDAFQRETNRLRERLDVAEAERDALAAFHADICDAIMRAATAIAAQSKGKA